MKKMINKTYWLRSHAPFLSLFPLLLFLAIFVTFGINSCQGGKLTLSPTVAILPAVLMAFLWKPRAFNKNLDVFMAGVGHSNILLMCFVFLLSGAFSSVMSSIGYFYRFIFY
jgi:Na+/H+ antiporter NhaC